MLRAFALSFAAGLSLSAPVLADFSGTFELGPPGCQQGGECVLTYDFKYIDPDGLGWQAAADNTTDGASIPFWAQPFVGGPFDESYIKAAVLHDHYCVRHVRSWRATHRMFHDALIELGVAPAKSKLMYYAVYVGGPKWVKLIPGNDCGSGNCVFEVNTDDATKKASVLTIVRENGYHKDGFEADLKEVEELIASQGDEIDLDYLERRAHAKFPTDFFYENHDEFVVSHKLIVE